MLKFNKVFSSKILVYGIIVIFYLFSTPPIYSYSNSKDTLRLPIGEALKRVKKAMKKEAETNDAVSPDGSTPGHRNKAVYKYVDELTERLKRSLLDAGVAEEDLSIDNLYGPIGFGDFITDAGRETPETVINRFIETGAPAKAPALCASLKRIGIGPGSIINIILLRKTRPKEFMEFVTTIADYFYDSGLSSDCIYDILTSLIDQPDILENQNVAKFMRSGIKNTLVSSVNKMATKEQDQAQAGRFIANFIINFNKIDEPEYILESLVKIHSSAIGTMRFKLTTNIFDFILIAQDQKKTIKSFVTIADALKEANIDALYSTMLFEQFIREDLSVDINYIVDNHLQDFVDFAASINNIENLSYLRLTEYGLYLMSSRFEYREVFTAKQLATLIYIDDYYTGDSKHITQKSISWYFEFPLFSKVRVMLWEQDYAPLKEMLTANTVSKHDIIRAILLNNQNQAISSSSDLILQYAGTRGILDGMTPLLNKLEATFGDKFRLTKKDISNLIMALDLDVSDEEIESILRNEGFKYHGTGDSSLILPLIYDSILSAYRGTAEYDSMEANYLTHALTTAICHYAQIGGEFAKIGEDEGKSCYGANAFHEFDLALMAIEGRNNRKVDTMVTLAFYYEGVPLPEYARKRTIVLEGFSVAECVDQLLRWQFEERRAKQYMYETMTRIVRGDLRAEELNGAIVTLKEQVEILKSRCGLRNQYTEMIVGYLDEEFFDNLRKEYKQGESNKNRLEQLLVNNMRDKWIVSVAERPKAQRIIRSKGSRIMVFDKQVLHPWLQYRKTLLDYLEYEAKARKGTFEDVDLSAEKEKFERLGLPNDNVETAKAIINNSNVDQEIKAMLIQKISTGDRRIADLLVKAAPQMLLIKTTRGNLLNHTLYVMHDIYVDENLDAISFGDEHIIKETMVIVALLHDVGKIKKDATTAHIQQSLQYLRYNCLEVLSGFEINLISFLIEQDIIGRLLTNKISPQDAERILDAGAKSIQGISKQQLFELSLSFYCANIGQRRFGRKVFGVGPKKEIIVINGRPVIPTDKYPQFKILESLILADYEHGRLLIRVDTDSAL